MRTLSPTHIKVGEKMRQLRKKYGLTQEDMAYKVGVDRSYMGFLERGEKNPTLSTLMKIAIALKVEIKEMFE